MWDHRVTNYRRMDAFLSNIRTLFFISSAKSKGEKKCEIFIVESSLISRRQKTTYLLSESICIFYLSIFSYCLKAVFGSGVLK